jgi:hypothetical protein
MRSKRVPFRHHDRFLIVNSDFGDDDITSPILHADTMISPSPMTAWRSPCKESPVNMHSRKRVAPSLIRFIHFRRDSLENRSNRFTAVHTDHYRESVGLNGSEGLNEAVFPSIGTMTVSDFQSLANTPAPGVQRPSAGLLTRYPGY